MSYKDQCPKNTSYPLPEVHWANDEDNASVYEHAREYIMAAATIHDGKCYAAKHHCICYRTIGRLSNGVKYNGSLEEGSGFLTNLGRFVTRDDGLVIAKNRGQVGKDFTGTLYSEDLW